MAISIAENKVRYLAFTAASIAAILTLGFGIGIKNAVSYTVTAVAALVFVFDLCLWRILPEWLSGVPQIYGTWQGSLKGRWINPDSKADTKKNVNPMFLSVKQTFSLTKIFAYTKESESGSMCVSIRKKENGNWTFSYVYDNEPDLIVRKKSQRHRGATELQIITINGTRQLSGEYWTDRWSQGEVMLDKRKRAFATSFADACHLFGVTV